MGHSLRRSLRATIDLMSDAAQTPVARSISTSLKTTLLPSYQPPTPSPAPSDDNTVTDNGSAAPAGGVNANDSSDAAQIQPPQTGGVTTAKEKFQPGIVLERPSVDQSSGVQMVEVERSPELPPEVESFIEKIEQHPDQLPQEVVINDPHGTQPTTKYLAQPVVVLPITPDVEQVGEKANPQMSVRWLVEWCWKMMKVFSGKIIYRQVESPS